MQYCENCTAPRTPEYLLYLYHDHLRSLPWRHLHPDTLLMEQLFKVRHPASPKTLTPPTLHTGLDSHRTDKLLILNLDPCLIVSIISSAFCTKSPNILFLEVRYLLYTQMDTQNIKYLKDSPVVVTVQACGGGLSKENELYLFVSDK